jgi:hypothetical protein
LDTPGPATAWTLSMTSGDVLSNQPKEVAVTAF